MMICTVNGQRRQWTTPVTVAALLTELNLRGQKIAVEKKRHRDSAQPTQRRIVGGRRCD